MKQLTVTITDAEFKALSHSCYDPQEWLDNAIHERCRHSIEEIFQMEIAKMIADPTVTSIPADRDQVVLAADIKTAKETRDAYSLETIIEPHTEDTTLSEQS